MNLKLIKHWEYEKKVKKKHLPINTQKNTLKSKKIHVNEVV